MDNILLIVDGGSKGNPGPIYGAYYFEIPVDDTLMVRGPYIIPFGIDGTNNEAEYKAMILGLDKLGEALDKLHIEPSDYNIAMLSDSSLAVNQILENCQIKAKKFKPLKKEVLQMLDRFHTFSIQWVPRDITNAYLGC